MKPGHTGLNRLIKATAFSSKGLKWAWKNEAAFRQEVCATLLLTFFAFFFDVSATERVLLIGSLLLVIIIELLNSAIEAVVDRIGSEHHELSGAAKDMGSAAISVSLVLVIFVWVSILIF